MNTEQRLGTEKIGKLLVTFSDPCIISLVLNATCMSTMEQGAPMARKFP